MLRSAVAAPRGVEVRGLAHAGTTKRDQMQAATASMLAAKMMTTRTGAGPEQELQAPAEMIGAVLASSKTAVVGKLLVEVIKRLVAAVRADRVLVGSHVDHLLAAQAYTRPCRVHPPLGLGAASPPL